MYVDHDRFGDGLARRRANDADPACPRGQEFFQCGVVGLGAFSGCCSVNPCGLLSSACPDKSSAPLDSSSSGSANPSNGDGAAAATTPKKSSPATKTAAGSAESPSDPSSADNSSSNSNSNNNSIPNGTTAAASPGKTTNPAAEDGRDPSSAADSVSSAKGAAPAPRPPLTTLTPLVAPPPVASAASPSLSPGDAAAAAKSADKPEALTPAASSPTLSPVAPASSPQPQVQPLTSAAAAIATPPSALRPPPVAVAPAVGPEVGPARVPAPATTPAAVGNALPDATVLSAAAQNGVGSGGDSSKIPIGAIIGISVGGFVLLCLVGALLFFKHKRRVRRTEARADAVRDREFGKFAVDGVSSEVTDARSGAFTDVFLQGRPDYGLARTMSGSTAGGGSIMGIPVASRDMLTDRDFRPYRPTNQNF